MTALYILLCAVITLFRTFVYVSFAVTSTGVTLFSFSNIAIFLDCSVILRTMKLSNPHYWLITVVYTISLKFANDMTMRVNGDNVIIFSSPNQL